MSWPLSSRHDFPFVSLLCEHAGESTGPSDEVIIPSLREQLTESLKDKSDGHSALGH